MVQISNKIWNAEAQPIGKINQNGSYLVFTISKFGLFSLDIEWFFSEVPAKTHRRHSLLHAVRKSTSKVKQLVGERVLPCYKGKGKKIGNTQNFITKSEPYMA